MMIDINASKESSQLGKHTMIIQQYCDVDEYGFEQYLSNQATNNNLHQFINTQKKCIYNFVQCMQTDIFWNDVTEAQKSKDTNNKIIETQMQHTAELITLAPNKFFCSHEHKIYSDDRCTMSSSCQRYFSGMMRKKRRRTNTPTTISLKPRNAAYCRTHCVGAQ